MGYSLIYDLAIVSTKDRIGSVILHWWLYVIYRKRKEIESNFVSCQRYDFFLNFNLPNPSSNKISKNKKFPGFFIFMTF
jgi:hypothetical protein